MSGVSQPQPDRGRVPGDLAGDELEAPARALVVEQDAAGRVEVVRLPVIDRDEVTVDLGHSIRGPRIERRQLVLRNLPDPAKHLARRRLVEPCLRADLAHGLEHPRDPHAGELRGQRRLDPRHRHERHRSQVVDLIRLRRPQRIHERALVEQIGLMQRHAVAEMLDPLEPLGRRTPDKPMHVVPLVEQQFREVGAVLAGDSSDQRRPGPGHAAGGYTLARKGRLPFSGP